MRIKYITKMVEERAAELKRELEDLKKLTAKATKEENLEAVELNGRRYTEAYTEWYKLTEALVHLR